MTQAGQCPGCTDAHINNEMCAVTTVTFERAAKMSSRKQNILSLEDRIEVVECLLEGISQVSHPEAVQSTDYH